MRTQRIIRRSLAASFSVLALTVGLTACIGVSPDSHDYPEQVRTNFIDSCSAQDGAAEGMCGRCFEAIEAEFTYGEFVKIDKAAREGNMSEEDSARFQEVMVECR